MEQLARNFIFLEMLFVNLVTMHNCCRKKYSVRRVISVLSIITGLILFLSFFLRGKFNLQYLHGYILILLGLIYFFPLKYLYRESAGKTLVIMIFSWTHTMAITYFCIQVATLFGLRYHFQMALLIQTLVYSFSTPLLIKFVRRRFFYILKNIPREMNKYLIMLSLAEFTTLTITIIYFSESAHLLLRLITVFSIALTAVISYHLIYIIVKNSKNINVLEHLAYTDDLTGISNRLALFLDCEKLILDNKPFSMIYMDLDNFKKVNDMYGHSFGDDYLKKFTEAARETLGNKGSIYRMSGDEFICLYRGDKIDLLLETFNEKIVKSFGIDKPFLGVSIGYAIFPQDASSVDDLIQKADNVMYKVKKQSKGNPVHY